MHVVNWTILTRVALSYIALLVQRARATGQPNMTVARGRCPSPPCRRDLVTAQSAGPQPGRGQSGQNWPLRGYVNMIDRSEPSHEAHATAQARRRTRTNPRKPTRREQQPRGMTNSTPADSAMQARLASEPPEGCCQCTAYMHGTPKWA